jgi:1-acyl-sn-glycerol-3-phosphate acyltransferase
MQPHSSLNASTDPSEQASTELVMGSTETRLYEAEAHGQVHAGPVCGWLPALIGKLVLFVSGWKTEGAPPDLSRAIFIAAPHTTNWDLVYMLAVAWGLRIRLSWMGKHTLFEGPFGWFMRAIGGLPVDRRSRNNLVQQVAEHVHRLERVYLAVAPEGTRKFTDHWKTGFYHMAVASGVPIVCGYLDYRRKAGGIGPVLFPTGDIQADMERLRRIYAPIHGLIPEFQGPVRLKDDPLPSA